MNHWLIHLWLITISQVNCNVWSWSWKVFSLVTLFAAYTQAFLSMKYWVISTDKEANAAFVDLSVQWLITISQVNCNVWIWTKKVFNVR